MRNLLSRTLLGAAALFLAVLLLGSDFSAEPAGASTLPRSFAAHGSYGTARRRALPAPRRLQRPSRWRVSRSAFRALADEPGDVWVRLRACESGGRYDTNTGNGFYGAYQFHPRTWRNLGFPGLPHQATPELQDEAARRLQARSGWGQWPVCSRRIGARR
jgi:hypothetical protein